MGGLTPRLGNWVDGDAFFDRVHEMAAFMRAIDAGDHVSLIAQRRVGKSSLLKEAARRHGDRYTFVYVDLQDFTEPRDVVLAIAAAARADPRAWTLVRSGLERVLGSLEQVGGERFAVKLRDGLGADWRAQGDRLLADLAAGSPPPVLLLDELPMLLGRVLRDGDHRPRTGGIEQADLLLSWLRRNALAHAGKLRIVVTGSIGLEPLARQVGLSGALNVYAPMLLPAWDAPVAVEALHALGAHEGLTWSPEAAERVVELLGSNIPYHVQVVFRHVADDAARLRRTQISARDVDRVYRTRVLAHHGHAELAHMEERLRRVLPMGTSSRGHGAGPSPRSC